MKALRYKDKTLEKLENNERIQKGKKVNKYNVSPDLWKVLEQNDVVYLKHHCDIEFYNKHKNLIYF